MLSCAAAMIADSPSLPAEMEQPGACAELLRALCNQGSVAFNDED